MNKKNFFLQRQSTIAKTNHTIKYDEIIKAQRFYCTCREIRFEIRRKKRYVLIEHVWNNNEKKKKQQQTHKQTGK